MDLSKNPQTIVSIKYVNNLPAWSPRVEYEGEQLLCSTEGMVAFHLPEK